MPSLPRATPAPLPLTLHLRPCAKNSVLPLLPDTAYTPDILSLPGFHRFHSCPDLLPSYPVGTTLLWQKSPQDPPLALFSVCGSLFLPPIVKPCLLLKALIPIDDALPYHGVTIIPQRTGYSAAFITLSDKGCAHEREDRSGPLMAELTRAALPLDHEQNFLLPDNPDQLRALALELATLHGYDMLLCSGGTGLSPRDLTPEALLPLLSRRLPGIEHAMMQTSLAKTPHAMLSRALAGTINSTLVLALPGSTKAVLENLSAALPALPHALEKLDASPTDCGN